MIGDSDTYAISQNVNFMKTSLFTSTSISKLYLQTFIAKMEAAKVAKKFTTYMCNLSIIQGATKIGAIKKG